MDKVYQRLEFNNNKMTQLPMMTTRTKLKSQYRLKYESCLHASKQRNCVTKAGVECGGGRDVKKELAAKSSSGL